jgi:hypothetical protein
VGGTATFDVLVNDSGGTVQRVIVLYRLLTSNTWTRLELSYNAGTQRATGSVSGVTGPAEFIVQAADSSGNVALALDHGNPFAVTAGTAKVYLPLIRR